MFRRLDYHHTVPGGPYTRPRSCLVKAQQKVKDRQENVAQLESSVQRLEEWVGRGSKVKEEEVHEEVEEVGKRVKDELEEKVVEEKAEGGGGFVMQSRHGLLGPQKNCGVPHVVRRADPRGVRINIQQWGSNALPD